MKFSRLVDKFEKLLRKHEQGKQFKREKLQKLQNLLDDKKSRYEAKLAEIEDPEKYKELETRLKVVTIQLDKLSNILP